MGSPIGEGLTSEGSIACSNRPLEAVRKKQGGRFGRNEGIRAPPVVPAPGSEGGAGYPLQAPPVVGRPVAKALQAGDAGIEKITYARTTLDLRPVKDEIRGVVGKVEKRRRFSDDSLISVALDKNGRNKVINSHFEAFRDEAIGHLDRIAKAILDISTAGLQVTYEQFVYLIEQGYVPISRVAYKNPRLYK